MLEISQIWKKGDTFKYNQILENYFGAIKDYTLLQYMVKFRFPTLLVAIFAQELYFAIQERDIKLLF